MTLADEKRAEVVRHWEFLIEWGPRRISYLYGGGLGWVDQSEIGMRKRFNAGEVWDADCRATVNWATRWSGWKGFGRYGFEASSGEMFEVLPRFSEIRDAEIGTLVVYGPGGGDHVAQVIADAGSSNPTLGSHGSAFSANKVSYLAETAYHAGLGQSPTLLAVSGLL
jgi:hypothetical protein